MQTLRHMALGICLLCAAAGMIRIFWPDNQFKPVINTVLLLYILTSVLQAGTGTDWGAVADGISDFSSPQVSPADITAYQEQLGRDVSVQALEDLFLQKGIGAGFEWENETLHIKLREETDLSAAQELLKENSGTLAYVLETEGGR